MIGEKLREYTELLERESKEFNVLKSTIGKKIETDKFKIGLAEKNKDAVGLFELGTNQNQHRER